MSVKQNFDRLSREVQETLNIEMDGIKLSLVESLSLFFADILSWLLVAVFSLLSLLGFLAAAVVAIAAVMGYALSFVVVAFLLLSVALLLYMLRGRLFTDMAVARFCRMFFRDKEGGNETV